MGSVRVGVALCDPGGVLASPLVTLARDEVGSTDLDRLVALAEEHEVVEVVVGLPRTLADRHGPAADAARAYAEALVARLPAAVGVVEQDERFSTVTASRMLSQRGVRGRRQRQVIDQAAAVEILQARLDAVRRETS